MVEDNGFHSIGFARLAELPRIFGRLAEQASDLSRGLSPEVLDTVREELLQCYMDPELHVSKFIKSDPAVLSTYLGYLKFLELDLGGPSDGSISPTLSDYSSGEESVHSQSSTSTPRSVASDASEYFGAGRRFGESRSSFRKRIQAIAKKMIGRGKVRLSTSARVSG